MQNYKKKLLEENENIKKQVDEANSIIARMNQLGGYNSETKKEINEQADIMIGLYKDWRGHCIKTSKKKDLIRNIIIVCEHNLKSLVEKSVNLTEKFLEFAQDEEKNAKRKTANDLADKVYPYKDEYIRGFESISEGVRQWDCLYDLIETGYVVEDQLPEYGIDLSVPPEKF